MHAFSFFLLMGRFASEEFDRTWMSFRLSCACRSNLTSLLPFCHSSRLTITQTGLSPLVPGQWKSLLAAYAGLYAIITLMRPIRIAAAAALASRVETLLLWTQQRLNCGRSTAIGVNFSAGLLIWMLCAAAGVSIASAASGVPIMPAAGRMVM